MSISFGGDPMVNPMQSSDGPSAFGYILGAIFIVLGVAGGIVWGVVNFVDFQDAIDDFERVPVGQVGTVDLDEGEYVVYAERGGGEALSAFLSEVRMRPAGQEGAEEIEFEEYEAEFTYEFGGRVGRAQQTFEIEDAGEYQVRVSDVGSTATTAAFGPSVASDLVAAILGAFVIAGIGIVVGVVLLIVTGVRRRKWRQRTWLDAAGGQPGMNAPGTWNPPAAPGGFGSTPTPGAWNPAPPPGGDFPPPPYS